MTLMELILPLTINLPFVRAMFLPIVPFVDLQNALPTVVVVHRALLPTRELTPQTEKRDSRPTLTLH